MFTKIRDYSAALIEANPVVAFWAIASLLVLVLVGWLV